AHSRAFQWRQRRATVKRSDMIATTLRQLARRIAPLIVIIALAAATWTRARAADTSPWDGDAHAGLRLVAGSRTNERTGRAGLQIRRPPGWETYRRDPRACG